MNSNDPQKPPAQPTWGASIGECIRMVGISGIAIVVLWVVSAIGNLTDALQLPSWAWTAIAFLASVCAPFFAFHRLRVVQHDSDVKKDARISELESEIQKLRSSPKLSFDFSARPEWDNTTFSHDCFRTARVVSDSESATIQNVIVKIAEFVPLSSQGEGSSKEHCASQVGRIMTAGDVRAGDHLQVPIVGIDFHKPGVMLVGGDGNNEICSVGYAPYRIKVVASGEDSRPAFATFWFGLNVSNMIECRMTESS